MPSPLRLTADPFPPYRHRPGVTPHPVTDPRGHSFGLPPHPPALPPAPELWRTCHAYLLGCDLFNHAYWWEAHEAWESPWRALPRDSLQARYLQALIQVAAALIKLDAGENAGGLRSLDRARENIAPALTLLTARGTPPTPPATYMGLDALAWWKEVDSLRAAPTPLPTPYLILA